MTATDEPAPIEVVTLTLLDRSTEPVGSARLAETLRQAGVLVAEATAGRFLRHLDERGYTRSINTTKGRVITEAGRQRLHALRALKRRTEQGAAVARAVNATEIDDLIDLLHVRRAVESEAARAAATRASAAELERIGAFAAAHVQEASAGAAISEPSMSFHRLVAEASHNRLLIAMTLLLLDPANDPLEKLLEAIAGDEGVTLDHVPDHVTLAEALQARDAAAAEVTMRAHMDRMLRTVAAYRARTAADRGPRHPGAGGPPHPPTPSPAHT